MALGAGQVEPEQVGILDDRDLAAEIALLGEVLAAIADVGHELTDSEVDEVLGVDPDDAPADGCDDGRDQGP